MVCFIPLPSFIYSDSVPSNRRHASLVMSPPSCHAPIGPCRPVSVGQASVQPVPWRGPCRYYLDRMAGWTDQPVLVVRALGSGHSCSTDRVADTPFSRTSCRAEPSRAHKQLQERPDYRLSSDGRGRPPSAWEASGHYQSSSGHPELIRAMEPLRKAICSTVPGSICEVI